MTLRPGISAQTSAATFATAKARDEARRDAARGSRSRSSRAPARFAAGSSTQRRRLFCGPSSRRVARPLWMYSTCDQSHGADRAVAHQLPRVARHRISRIRVRDRKQASAAARCARPRSHASSKLYVTGLSQTTSSPGVERRRGVRIVRVVRRHDGHRIDAVGTLALLRQHLGDVTVAPRGIEADGCARGARLARVARHDARHDAEPPVQSRPRFDACGRSRSLVRPRRSRGAASVRISPAVRSCLSPIHDFWQRGRHVTDACRPSNGREPISKSRRAVRGREGPQRARDST